MKGEQWSKVIWSDECSFELGKGKQNQWVWRLNHFNEKWKYSPIRQRQSNIYDDLGSNLGWWSLWNLLNESG